MNTSMNKRRVCGIWGAWLAAMVLCLGSLPGLATADGEQSVSPESRVWTDSTGRFSVDSELVGVAGDQVTLKRVADGRQITLRIEQLSAADQQHLLGEQRGKTPAPTQGATAPPLAVAPFDAATAKEHQEAWAKNLAIPVEVTNSIRMKFKLIPPGEFMMESPESDPDAHVWEKPQHMVHITKSFYLGVTEGVQDQYDRVMGTNPSKFKGAQLPMENVSWEDAVEFCRKLSALPAERSDGRVYRLPTEAAWEYACRAGSTGHWCFGDDESMLKQYAWYQANANGTTHPVGTRKPNAWGLYDMHGNVSEWCADWYDVYASWAVDDPTGPAAGPLRAIRGGGWGSHGGLCRSAFRGRGAPVHRVSPLGFRLALSSVDQSGQ